MSNIIDIPHNNCYFLTGEISSSYLRNFTKTLSSKTDPIYIVIDTIGGSFQTTWAMLHLMKTSPVHITTIAMGNVCSGGFHIFLEGDTRLVMDSASFMAHRVYDAGDSIVDVADIVNLDPLKKYVKSFGYTLQQQFEHLKGKTNVEDKHIEGTFLSKLDCYYIPNDMIKFGVVDNISNIRFV